MCRGKASRFDSRVGHNNGRPSHHKGQENSDPKVQYVKMTWRRGDWERVAVSGSCSRWDEGVRSIRPKKKSGGKLDERSDAMEGLREEGKGGNNWYQDRWESKQRSEAIGSSITHPKAKEGSF